LVASLGRNANWHNRKRNGVSDPAGQGEDAPGVSDATVQRLRNALMGMFKD